jgi:hypothetical protein
MDTKRSILIISFLHLIQEKRSKGRWEGTFMNNIFLLRYGMVLAMYGGERSGPGGFLDFSYWTP